MMKQVGVENQAKIILLYLRQQEPLGKALTYIKRNRANVKIMEAGLVTDASGTVTYGAEMKGGKELVFEKVMLTLLKRHKPLNICSY